jgi:hypothetical protein
MARVRPTPCGDLLDFNEVQRRLQLGPRTDIGIHEIPVAQVVGSVSRVHEFDGCFRPRTRHLKKLLAEIRAGRPDNADVPILVHQVDQAYFVVDGHKRMALAVEDGRRFIDAEVGSFASRFHVSGGTTIDEIKATELERRFRDVTGLATAVPEARFPLANFEGYLELAESVKAHAYDLSRKLGRLVDPVEGARHWYDLVYAPGVALAKESRLHWLLNSSTEPELYLVLRRGALYESEDLDWQVPDMLSDRAVANLRAAEPAAIPNALARAAGRRHEPATVLDAADLEIDQRAAPRTGDRAPEPRAVIRRPRRERESAD